MKPNTRHFLVIIGTLVGFYLSYLTFNHIHAWGGIFLFFGVLILSINYFVKQLKNL